MAQDVIEVYNQGYYYYTGTEGYPLNYVKALDYFKQAASLGSSDAMNYIGLIYEEGDVVEQSDALAVEWFYNAIQADQSNAYAAFNLGRMCYNGSGTEKNLYTAYQYYKLAVDLGIGNTHAVYPQSCYMTGCILIEHFNNYTDAYPYFIEAAQHGNIPEAWYNLGWLTEKGVIPVDQQGGNKALARDNAALSYYLHAAEQEDASAMDAVGRLYAAHNMLDKAAPYIEKAASMGYEPAKKRLKLLRVAQGGSFLNLFG